MIFRFGTATDLLRRAIKKLLFGHEVRPRRVLFGSGRRIVLLTNPAHGIQRLTGLAERELQPHLSKCIANARSFIDVGASNGWYSLLAAKLNPRIQVVACEPDEEMIRELHENLALNPMLAAQIRIVDRAVGVGGVQLGALLNSLEKPVSVKIDVEGAELSVLESGGDQLGSSVMSLIIETHGKELERRCLELLNGAGFSTIVVDKGWYRAIVPEKRVLPHNRWIVALRKLCESS